MTPLELATDLVEKGRLDLAATRAELGEMVFMGADEKPTQMIKSAAKRLRPLGYKGGDQ